MVEVVDVKSPICSNSFSISMFFERPMHSEKELLFDFVKLEKHVLTQVQIEGLDLLAPKKTYNLINKCFLFNLTFDDNCDQYYLCNYWHQHKD